MANFRPAVMAGLDPAISVIKFKFWMAASRAAMMTELAEMRLDASPK